MQLKLWERVGLKDQLDWRPPNLLTRLKPHDPGMTKPHFEQGSYKVWNRADLLRDGTRLFLFCRNSSWLFVHVFKEVVFKT